MESIQLSIYQANEPHRVSIYVLMVMFLSSLDAMHYYQASVKVNGVITSEDKKNVTHHLMALILYLPVHPQIFA